MRCLFWKRALIIGVATAFGVVLGIGGTCTWLHIRRLSLGLSPPHIFFPPRASGVRSIRCPHGSSFYVVDARGVRNNYYFSVVELDHHDFANSAIIVARPFRGYGERIFRHLRSRNADVRRVTDANGVTWAVRAMPVSSVPQWWRSFLLIYGSGLDRAYAAPLRHDFFVGACERAKVLLACPGKESAFLRVAGLVRLTSAASMKVPPTRHR